MARILGRKRGSRTAVDNDVDGKNTFWGGRVTSFGFCFCSSNNLDTFNINIISEPKL